MILRPLADADRRGRDVAVVVESDLEPGDAEGGVDLTRWQALAAAALSTEGASGELNLVFVDEATMAELNVEHMQVEGPTDVLAFPLDGVDDVVSPRGPVPLLLGDVVICPAVARRYAAEHGVSFDDEVALLVVHGVLHVLGHDHAEPDETALMQARERALLDAHHRVPKAEADAPGQPHA